MNITLIALIAFLVVVTGCLSLRMFFEKKSGGKEWSAWANLITATSTLVVGVATIYVSFQENNTQWRLAKMEEAEHQPIFVVNEILDKSTNENIFDYEEFTIYNLGGLVKSITEVQVLAYAQVDYKKNDSVDEKKTVFVPIKDYYFHYYKTGAFQGEIARSYGSDKNHNNQLFVQRLYRGKTSLENIGSVNCELIKLYIIEFTDIFDKTKTVVFKGTSPGVCTNPSSMEYVNKVKSSAELVFGFEQFDLKELTLDMIISKAEQ